MAWRQTLTAAPGEYLLARTAGGISVDLFGAVTNLDLLQRLQQRADGWVVLDARVERRLFSGDIVVLGRAERPLLMDAFRAQVEDAINSYWTIALAEVSVWAGDDAGAPAPGIGPADDWAGTLKWISAAVIVAAVAYGIYTLRKLA